MMKASLVILAAGMGSRYGGLKQIDAFGPNGETILDYSIYDAIEAGFKKVVFIVREHFKKDIQAAFAGKFDDKVELLFVTQELDKIPSGFDIHEDREKPWGTSHALMMAADVVDGPFAVINGDDYYGKDSYRLLIDYFSTRSSADKKMCIVGYYLKNTLSKHGTVNRGICDVNEEGHLKGIVETLKIRQTEGGSGAYELGDKTHHLDKDTLVSMNMFGMFPEYFDKSMVYFHDFLRERGNELKSEFFIPTVVDRMSKEDGYIFEVLESPSSWFGVTYKEDKPIVIEKIAKLIEEGAYPKHLWS